MPKKIDKYLIEIRLTDRNVMVGIVFILFVIFLVWLASRFSGRFEYIESPQKASTQSQYEIEE